MKSDHEETGLRSFAPRSELEKVVDAYQSQTELTALYRDRLASGTLVNVVMHDVGVALKPTGLLVTHARKTKCDNKEHEEILSIIENLIPRVIGAYDLLRGAGRAGAYKVSSFPLSTIVDPLVERMKKVFSANPIEITSERSDVIVKMRSADLWAILVNLLANSATSSEYDHAREKQFPRDRKIILRIKSDHDNLIIECEDNGPGLPDKPEGWIWLPFNSTRSGGGSGLGLYIVSDAVIWYGGKYSAIKSKLFDCGSLFRISIPGVVKNAQ